MHRHIDGDVVVIHSGVVTKPLLLYGGVVSNPVQILRILMRLLVQLKARIVMVRHPAHTPTVIPQCLCAGYNAVFF